MGRKPQVNIVNVFTWFSNVLDIHDLDNSETVVMVHIIKYLNRNFWKPVKMSAYKLAKNLGKKDDRTVKAALKRLKEKHLIIESEEGEIYIGIDGAERHFKKRESKPNPELESEQRLEPDSSSNFDPERIDAKIDGETLNDYL